MSNLNRALILDRDGVINQKAQVREYIKSWAEFVFLPYSLDGLRIAATSNYKIIIATNQRGIALGKMKRSDVDEIHKNMIDEIKKFGGRIDAVYVCPHDEGQCECRKPKPGMLDIAAKEFNLNLKNSWMIGDSIIDMNAGLARGCKLAYIGDRYEGKVDLIKPTLYDIMCEIIK